MDFVGRLGNLEKNDDDDDDDDNMMIKCMKQRNRQHYQNPLTLPKHDF